ncbi:response regulator transcription factor [Burkholderia lata]|uniref:Two component transcriptional regulator, winged helix family n=1 Tax=Burkholderia lata (strain ATCC 17760 / DSM 23089 / LMG 22485 / NCIMB 9086 / R18194 / 383) TaxID=482957 RepID=Q39PH4_BURL3|nr:response regulator transcription factor [Burkholderia lata]ABB05642.1 two component transcriptional regulator, winged helix family [Burkholderia lata]
MRIAILGPDPVARGFAKEALVRVGHVCQTFSSGNEIIRQLRRETYDLLILDWLVTDISGEEVMLWAHKNLPGRVPVIFLSKRGRDEDLVRILAAGADGYLVKPISGDVLAAYVNALARSIAGVDLKGRLSVREFEFDLRRKILLANGACVETTPKEFDIALLFFRNLGNSVSRGHLLDIVWRQHPVSVSRTVDTHISNVRTKLNLNPENGYVFKPIYGFGYILDLVR